MESKAQLAPGHIVSWWQNQNKVPETHGGMNHTPPELPKIKSSTLFFFPHLCFLRGKWPFTIFSVFNERYLQDTQSLRTWPWKVIEMKGKKKKKNIFHPSWAEIGYLTNLKSEQFFLVYKYVSSFEYQMSHSLTVKSIHKQGLCTQGPHSPHILWGYPVSVTRLSPQDEDTSWKVLSGTSNHRLDLPDPLYLFNSCSPQRKSVQCWA